MKPMIYASLQLTNGSCEVYDYEQTGTQPVEKLGPFSGPALLAADRRNNLYVADPQRERYRCLRAASHRSVQSYYATNLYEPRSVVYSPRALWR
ncbi:MAG: hypothetical protein JO060_09055 [Candidatus Eremiobacteraeota bacterium]|nr:hypothetical protein [Candidatus Eremiobacteraeota bacterium]MBV9646060.1 hypothetical protein [Candidatus Eremiobacteraeota bacterium]